MGPEPIRIRHAEHDAVRVRSAPPYKGKAVGDLPRPPSALPFRPMTTKGGHDVSIFHVYGWKGPRMNDGPYYLAGPTNERQAIENAGDAQGPPAAGCQPDSLVLRTGAFQNEITIAK